AAGLLAACGGGSGDRGGTTDGGAGATLVPGASERSGEIEFLVPNFPDGFRGPSVLIPGREQRVTFVLRDNVDILRREVPDSIELTIRDSTGERVGGGQVAVHADGIATPYYPVIFTPGAVGQYVATVEGTSADPVPFTVVDPEEVGIVQIGDPMRPVATPTFDDARGVDPICTRAEPCRFHELSLDEALTLGRPTVLLMSTPGFCQTDICGPVLELLIEAMGERTAEVGVVHAEVYVDPSQFASGNFPDLTPALQTYSLPFEPQLLVADATGTIVSRLDTTWDRAELGEALAPTG
ncbi:MAG: hypothetical protein ACE5GB_08550, partial [Acidimicrobiales bacterium]